MGVAPGQKIGERPRKGGQIDGGREIPQDRLQTVDGALCGATVQEVGVLEPGGGARQTQGAAVRIEKARGA